MNLQPLLTPEAVGVALFVTGVFYRGWSEHRVVHHTLSGATVTERVYSVWADVVIAAGIALFLYGVFAV